MKKLFTIALAAVAICATSAQAGAPNMEMHLTSGKRVELLTEEIDAKKGEAVFLITSNVASSDPRSPSVLWAGDKVFASFDPVVKSGQTKMGFCVKTIITSNGEKIIPVPNAKNAIQITDKNCLGLINEWDGSVGLDLNKELSNGRLALFYPALDIKRIK